MPSGPQISAKELADIREAISKLEKALEDIEDLKHRVSKLEYRSDELEKNKADKTDIDVLEHKKADRMELDSLRKLIDSMDFSQ